MIHGDFVVWNLLDVCIYIYIYIYIYILHQRSVCCGCDIDNKEKSCYNRFIFCGSPIDSKVVIIDLCITVIVTIKKLATGHILPPTLVV